MQTAHRGPRLVPGQGSNLSADGKALAPVERMRVDTTICSSTCTSKFTLWFVSITKSDEENPSLRLTIRLTIGREQTHVKIDLTIICNSILST